MKSTKSSEVSDRPLILSNSGFNKQEIKFGLQRQETTSVQSKFVDSLKSNDSVVTQEKSANDTHCNIKIRLDKSSMKKKSTKRYKKLKSKKTTLIEMQTKEDEGFQNCQENQSDKILSNDTVSVSDLAKYYNYIINKKHSKASKFLTQKNMPIVCPDHRKSAADPFKTEKLTPRQIERKCCIPHTSIWFKHNSGLGHENVLKSFSPVKMSPIDCQSEEGPIQEVINLIHHLKAKRYEQMNFKRLEKYRILNMPKISQIVKEMKKNLYIESGFSYNHQDFNTMEAALKSEIK